MSLRARGRRATEDRDDLDEPTLLEAAMRLPKPPADWRQDAIGRVEFAASRLSVLEEVLRGYRGGPLKRAPEKCERHPRYAGKGAPRARGGKGGQAVGTGGDVPCPTCVLIYEAAQGGRAEG